MTDKTILSVIVPVYNVEEYLDRCIMSIIDQRIPGMEIIIVNDGSTDKSQHIIDLYQARYPDIIRSFIKENGGLSDARNYGLIYAKGIYVSFVDSDDYLVEGAYSSVFQQIKSFDKKLIVTDYNVCYENGKCVRIKEGRYSSIREYLIDGKVVAWNKLYNRKWLEKMKLSFPKGLVYEDIYLFFCSVTALESIQDIQYIDVPMVNYYQRGNSISNSSSTKIEHIVKIYDLIKENLIISNRFWEYYQELEYREVRNELWGYPIKKIRKLDNKQIRKELLNCFWDNVHQKWPNYKKNKYIKRIDLANVYLYIINKEMYILLWSI